MAYDWEDRGRYHPRERGTWRGDRDRPHENHGLAGQYDAIEGGRRGTERPAGRFSSEDFHERGYGDDPGYGERGGRVGDPYAGSDRYAPPLDNARRDSYGADYGREDPYRPRPGAYRPYYGESGNAFPSDLGPEGTGDVPGPLNRWERGAVGSDVVFGGRRYGSGDLRPRGEHRGRGPKNYSRADDRIVEDVSDRLTDDPMLDASGIEVSVKDGEITLGGTVTERFFKRRAEDIAESVSGVGHVQNNLRIRREEGDPSSPGDRG